MYFYSYYDYLIKSNIELFNFNPATEIIGLRPIYVYYIEYDPQKFIKNPEFEYVCYEDVIFELRIVEMTINIISMDTTCFQEVIRNKPFACFCNLDNRFVLHASAIISNNSVIAFCGAKGAGKTTLSLFLSSNYMLFTDDQLCLSLEDEKTNAISSDNIQKITENTASILSVKDRCNNYNKQYKKYIYRSSNYTDTLTKPLVHIFILRRNIDYDYYVEKIRDPAHKMSHIISNSVGKKSYDDIQKNRNINNFISRINMEYLYYDDVKNCGEQLFRHINRIAQEG